MWVTHYPAAALGAARGVYSPPELEGMEAGYTALYQKCVHLGCRVPQCLTSQWFECQCHGSQYNRNGEKKGGPAPRGLDRFPLTVVERQRQRRTPAIIIRARPSAPTPPARRPKAPTASAAESTEPMTSLLLAAVVAATTVKAIGVVIAVVTGIGVVALHPRQPPPGPARGRRGDRARAEPQAVLRRRAARGPAPQPGAGAAASCSSPSPRSACRSTGSTSRAGRAAPSRTSTRPSSTAAAELFAPTEEGGYNCAGCHGSEGVGGQAPPYTLTDADGEFVATVTWRAPALNTVLLRFSRGGAARDPRLRPARHPDAGVGHRGRRPAHHPADRRADRLHRLDPAHLRRGQGRGRGASCATSSGLGEDDEIDWDDPATGEALFNLGLENGFAGGAYSCARCHTKGASFQYGPVEPEDADLSDYTGFPDGTGAFGFAAHQRRDPAPVPHRSRT